MLSDANRVLLTQPLFGPRTPFHWAFGSWLSRYVECSIGQCVDVSHKAPPSLYGAI